LEDKWSLKELCQLADVTERTVRYYIHEGLLPPSEGSGLAARYTQRHLTQLQAIKRMKEEYLPLAEIKRRLEQVESDEINSPERMKPVHRITLAVEPVTTDQSILKPDDIAERVKTPKLRAKPPLSSFPSEEVEKPLVSQSHQESPVLSHENLNSQFIASFPNEETWQRLQLGPGLELHYLQSLDQTQHKQLVRLLELAREIFSS
jgi:DNA-binding transcriptional MerR regulator